MTDNDVKINNLSEMPRQRECNCTIYEEKYPKRHLKHGQVRERLREKN